MKNFSCKLVLLILSFAVLFSGCTVSPIQIDNNVKEILSENNIEKSNIQSIDYDSIAACLNSDFAANDSLSRVSDYIDEVIEADFDYYKSQHSLIESNDIAIVDCYIYDNNNQCIYEGKNIKIFVGFNCFDTIIETELLGKHIGDAVTISSSKCTNEILTDYIDTDIKFIVTDIKNIDIKPGSEILNNEDFHTLPEYYEYLYSIKLDEIKMENKNQLKQDFFEKAINECAFELDYDEVKAYTHQIVSSYKSSYSSFGMTLEDYYNGILGLTEEEFFNQCTEEAIYEIKKYLLVGAISSYYNLTPSDDELCDYFKSKNISENEKKYAAYTYLENAVILLYSQM